MLRLVLPKDNTTSTHFQTALFPNSDPRSFFLVALPLRSGKEFLEIIESTSPALVVDMRDVPRFDFDFLSRGRVFEAFAKVKSTYIDAESTKLFERLEDRWTQLFATQKILAETKKGQICGPYMFLFSGYSEMPPFEQFLKKELPKIRPNPWSILHITNQEEFALRRFAR
jgi:hypothetical protein